MIYLQIKCYYKIKLFYPNVDFTVLGVGAWEMNLEQGLNEFGTFLIVPSLVHFSITIIIFAINWPYCAFYSLYTLR